MAVVAGCSQAKTIEYWDFEDGSAGVPFTAEGAESGSGGSNGENGTRMRGYTSTAGPSWTRETSGNGGNLAMDCDGGTQDGYVTEGALHNWTASNWTLEMHVKFETLDGFETLVGRDGTSASASASDFYLQRSGNTECIRLYYYTAEGEFQELSGSTVVEEEVWYGIAVVGNTSAGTITMYIDSGNGYAEDGKVSGLNGNLGIYSSSLNWTFGRGWFDNSQTDKTDLIMDNVRISDTALRAGDLIPLAALRRPALYIIR